MSNKARQQRANNKARKAKARAEHEAKFGTWLNRKQAMQACRPVSLQPFVGAALSIGAVEKVLAELEREDDGFWPRLRIGGEQP